MDWTAPEPATWFVLAEGENWLAVIKPRGLSTVPARNTDEVSLIIQLEQAGYSDLRTTGRLDRAVGGIVLFAIGPDAQRKISKAWHRPENRKRYRARTLAAPFPASGAVTLPIARGRKGSMKLGGDDARAARTDYRIIEVFANGWADVEATIATGRRHQIRLHLASLGAPIAGDTYYMRTAEVLAGFPGPTPPPEPPDKIDLWCVELTLPSQDIALTWQLG